MKKLEFWTLIAERNTAGCAKTKVEGYSYNSQIGVYKDNGLWHAIDLKTGTQINGVAFTRVEAVEQVEKILPKLGEFKNEPNYRRAIERFDKAPTKEDLCTI